jgi:hypothetical protein
VFGNVCLRCAASVPNKLSIRSHQRLRAQREKPRSSATSYKPRALYLEVFTDAGIWSLRHKVDRSKTSNEQRATQCKRPFALTSFSQRRLDDPTGRAELTVNTQHSTHCADIGLLARPGTLSKQAIKILSPLRRRTFESIRNHRRSTTELFRMIAVSSLGAPQLRVDRNRSSSWSSDDEYDTQSFLVRLCAMASPFAVLTRGTSAKKVRHRHLTIRKI